MAQQAGLLTPEGDIRIDLVLDGPVTENAGSAGVDGIRCWVRRTTGPDRCASVVAYVERTATGRSPEPAIGH